MNADNKTKTRYTAALDDLQKILSDETYRPVEADAFRKRHKVGTDFLNAVRHLDAVTANLGVSTPKTHWLKKTAKLALITPGDVIKQMRDDYVSTSKITPKVGVAPVVKEAVASMVVTADHLSGGAIGLRVSDQDLQTIAQDNHDKVLEGMKREITGNLAKWVEESDPDRPKINSAAGAELLQTTPQLPEGIVCSHVSAVYVQSTKSRTNQQLQLTQSRAKDGTVMIGIESRIWTVDTFDDLRGILADFEQRVSQTAPQVQSL